MTSGRSDRESDARPGINAGRLWAGGLAVALVAALVALAGIVIARGIFDVPILAPQGNGTWGDADTGMYAAAAAAAALAATGLMHLLVFFTPRPRRFFAWIMTLATLVAVLAPFGIDVGAAALATALVNLALGIAIGSLTVGVAAASTTGPPAGPGDPPPYPYGRGESPPYRY